MKWRDEEERHDHTKLKTGRDSKRRLISRILSSYFVSQSRKRLFPLHPRFCVTSNSQCLHYSWFEPWQRQKCNSCHEFPFQSCSGNEWVSWMKNDCKPLLLINSGLEENYSASHRLVMIINKQRQGWEGWGWIIHASKTKKIPKNCLNCSLTKFCSLSPSLLSLFLLSSVLIMSYTILFPSPWVSWEDEGGNNITRKDTE